MPGDDMTAGAPAARGPVEPEAVLDLIGPGTDLIVPLAVGEPVTVLDAVEEAAPELRDVRVHQMHALVDRPYLDGRWGSRLRHVSYFLSPVTRPHFHEGGVDLVPSHFSEVPALLAQSCERPVVLAAASGPDRHGYFSLGCNADYVASFIGRVPVFLEANEQMPRTHGNNTVHMSQVAGWCRVDRPLLEVPPGRPTDVDRAIGRLVAERIEDGSTIQVGLGAVPDAVMQELTDHHDLGVHTELVSDGLVALAEAGVVTGVHKAHHRNRMVTTFALGTRRVYDFLDENPVVEFLGVEYVNDTRVIASHDRFVSINATTEVDLLGQCASETIHGRYWSGSGGQADFAKGAMMSRDGQGFIALHSTAKDGATSRIVSRLTRGSVVTTLKNTVDKVVTEWGVAELRGATLSQRAERLIGVSHPDYRDQLAREAHHLGYLRH
ncbi:MAG: acetyl-CoA hydrolase/transferase family protein [Microthrixaceae bacterium]